VSPLYLYAVLGAAPGGDAGTGLAGETVRFVDCGDGLLAAAGEMSAAPAIAPESLRAHDAVVRRLAARADAVLPARFGMLARDVATLRARLQHAAPSLRDALARVAGCEQMILRVFRDEPEARDAPPLPMRSDASSRASVATRGRPPGQEHVDASTGPGTRYLADRARAQHAAVDVPELAPLRAALARLVTAERVDRHAAPPLVASVYHLVPRGEAAAYTAAVETAADALPDVRISVSGPWAPYAFAPDALE
jgi:hypothetical protein